jgi:hypothetical protein
MRKRHLLLSTLATPTLATPHWVPIRPTLATPTLATRDWLPPICYPWNTVLTEYSPGLVCCAWLIIDCNKQSKTFGICLPFVIYASFIQ